MFCMHDEMSLVPTLKDHKGEDHVISSCSDCGEKLGASMNLSQLVKQAATQRLEKTQASD